MGHATLYSLERTVHARPENPWRQPSSRSGAPMRSQVEPGLVYRTEMVTRSHQASLFSDFQQVHRLKGILRRFKENMMRLPEALKKEKEGWNSTKVDFVLIQSGEERGAKDTGCQKFNIARTGASSRIARLLTRYCQVNQT